MSTFAIDIRSGMPRTGAAVSSASNSSPSRSLALTEAQLLAVYGLSQAVIGTGSDVVNTLINVSARRATGSRASVIALADQADYIEPGKLTSEIVNAIRSAFGLSVTDLAAVLGVERPTIYSWLKDQSTPTPARLRRLGLVLRIADNWVAETGGSVAPSLGGYTKAGVSLLEALKEPTLWEAEILIALSAQATSAASKARRSRLGALARERGLEVVPSEEFNAATGRPLGPESY